MSKLLLLMAFCCILISQVLAQDASSRQFCDRLFADCLREEPYVGRRDDTVDLFNLYCFQNVFRGHWMNVSRCQLVKASCILTMVRCDNLSCKNVFLALTS
ncbi:uncharacterized protein LOC6605813 [Drosophila sechellia]|uniref:GM25551 n=1 Tax=Drosophila sechellia TaxID=7238 RepID=B4HII4_DROSE|nr:uncharacterized protein LOC6605813 [Drosophila sechellia]EDW41614.1 GM25551 [Drosophila sechellia]